MHKRDAIFISIAIGVVCFLYPLIFYNFSDIRAGDLAEYINNPLRVMDGQLPYQDFWLIFPPLEVYYPALLYTIFGVKMFTLFISSWIFGAGCTILAFLITMQLTESRRYSLLAAAVFFFSGFISHYSGFDYGGHIHLFFLLLATYIFIKSENLSKLQMILIGAFIGIGAGFRIDLCGAYYLALCGTLFYMKRKKDLTRSDFFKNLIYISLGCAIIFLALYLPFANIIPKIIIETVIKPPVHATVERVGPLATTLQLASQLSDGGLVSKGMTAFRLVYDVIYKLLPLATLGLFIFFMRKNKKEEKAPYVLLMLWALFTLPKSLAVIDVHYLSSINGILILPFMVLLKKTVFDRKDARILKILGIFSIFILLISVPASRAVDFIGYSKEPTYIVSGSQDHIYVKDPAEVYQIQSLIDGVEEYTSKGDYIFVSPFFAPPIYEMTGRKDPTYYDSVIDLGFLPDAEKQQAICDSLNENKVKLVVYGKDCQIYWNGQCLTEGFKVLDACVHENYAKEGDYGAYSIYLRK